MVSLKYVRNIWRTLEMTLINFKITFVLTWSKNGSSVTGTAANQELKFKITDTKLYAFWTQDNVKLLKQLESVFKTRIMEKLSI